MQAVIMCAGRGSRLSPLTDDIPKALVKIQDTSIISWVMEPLFKSGFFNNYVVVTGWQEDKLIDYLTVDVNKSKKYKMQFSTGGPRGFNADLQAAGGFLEDEFFVVNGDTYCALNYPSMYAWHRYYRRHYQFPICSGLACMAVSKYGEHNVHVDNRRVYTVGEPNYTDAGVYVMKKSVLDNLNSSSDSVDFGSLGIDGSITAFNVSTFYDLGTFERIERFEQAYLTTKGACQEE